MEASIIRILLVEDHEPFRRFVRSVLQQKPELQIMHEASDGLEAVQKAAELQPDLIVLDIGLPALNGIEAARRIRKLSPKTKILFLTQESSADLAQEALSLGALGYVVKTRAASELLAAVEAVCQGRRFVSGAVTGVTITQTQDGLGHGHDEALPSLASRSEGATRSHDVHFYPDDASFLTGFAGFIEAALKAGKAVIVIATASHQQSLLQRLQACGVDSAAAIEQGLYRPVDVDEMLATFVASDLPDPVQLRRIAVDLVAAAAKAAKGERPRVAVCGEGAPILWALGKADAAIQVERLWDEIARSYGVDILCGYVLNSFQREEANHVYEKICAAHSAVVAGEV